MAFGNTTFWANFPHQKGEEEEKGGKNPKGLFRKLFPPLKKLFENPGK